MGAIFKQPITLSANDNTFYVKQSRCEPDVGCAGKYQAIKKLDMQQVFYTLPAMYKDAPDRGYRKHALYSPTAAVMISVPLLIIAAITAVITGIFLFFFHFPIGAYFVVFFLTISLVTFLIALMTAMSVGAVHVYNKYVDNKNAAWVFDHSQDLVARHVLTAGMVREVRTEGTDVFLKEQGGEVRLIAQGIKQEIVSKNREGDVCVYVSV